HLSGDRLHLGIAQAGAVQKDGQRVPTELAVGEDIHLDEGIRARRSRTHRSPSPRPTEPWARPTHTPACIPRHRAPVTPNAQRGTGSVGGVEEAISLRPALGRRPPGERGIALSRRSEVAEDALTYPILINGQE